jgi:hypothetical protein
MERECGASGIARVVTAVHLNHLPNRPGSVSLILQFQASTPAENPVPADAFLCTAPHKCEGTDKASIEFRYLSEKAASGSYQIEFKDGRKEQGEFKVKAHQKFHGDCL